MTEESLRREIEHAAMERIRRQLEQVVLRKLRAGQTRVFTDPEVLALAQKLDELVVRKMAEMSPESGATACTPDRAHTPPSPPHPDS